MRTISDLISDLSCGVRQSRKNPSFAFVCIAVLAIGIGATTSVFAVLYDVLLKPLPYRDAAHIVYVHNEFASILGHTGASAPDYVALTAHRELFTETAAYYFNDFTMSSVRGSAYAEHVDAVNASATLFPLLGIQPELGRTFIANEDRFGAPKVAVLSDSFWHSRFGADPGIIGRTMQLEGEPYQIIGVMPPDFTFPFPATQMWVPLALRAEAMAPGERGNKWLRMLARVQPGLTLQRANAVLASAGHQLAEEDPDSYPEKSGWHFSIQPMLAEQTAEVRQWLLLAFGAVACVLLIACTNVSGLLTVRATVRRREWAVRSALGASTSRLVRQVLAETGMLAALGCAAGIALALALIELINTYGPIHRTELETRAVAFALGLSILSTIVAGTLPALLSSRVAIDPSLRTGGSRTSTGQSRWRGALVAGQISIAVALLFTATALSRSFVKLLAVPPGFSPEKVWTASVALPKKHYWTADSHSAFFRALVGRVSALPGVQAASAGMSLPFSSGGYTADLYVAGRAPASLRPAARVDIVLPGYFETLKIPLLKGRLFAEGDNRSSPSVVVVNEEFARRYFPGRDAIGQLVANNCCHDKLARIIGVVGNVATRDLAAPPRPQVYWSELQLQNSAMFLVVREADQMDVTSAVREILEQQDQDVALFDVATMPSRIADSVKLRRFVAWLLNSFALVGIVLAALGLYGMLAYLVQLRRREIAIRMAFGATAADVAALVGRHSFTLAFAGLLPGILLCAFAVRASRSFLFGVAPLDLWTLAVTAGGLLLLVVIATGPPLFKATGVDALAMLREE
jgi:putative ABC transport system permease protein